jgi:hypothetical protein
MKELLAPQGFELGRRRPLVADRCAQTADRREAAFVDAHVFCLRSAW